MVMCISVQVPLPWTVEYFSQLTAPFFVPFGWSGGAFMRTTKCCLTHELSGVWRLLADNGADTVDCRPDLRGVSGRQVSRHSRL